MAKLLMIVSSARTIRLADGSDHPTGYRAEEVRKPYEAFGAAGVNVVIATPDGKVPRPDPWGLEPFFHYPQVDEDFMFSVLRRFAYHADRVRVTFTHFSELNLVAIRRVYRGLLDAGMEPAGARKAVESAAHRAWRHNRDFIEVLAEDDEVTSRLPATRTHRTRHHHNSSLPTQRLRSPSQPLGVKRRTKDHIRGLHCRSLINCCRRRAT